MKDVVGFIKNFDIKIPHKESFEYYIETLSKSEEYNDLSEKVSLWEDYEDSLGDVSPKDAKYKTLISLVEHFKSLIGESINEYSESCLLNLEGKRKFQPEDVNFYISFDVKQGNWTVIRKALGETLPDWEKYLTDTLNIHPVLAKSKGSSNPHNLVKATLKALLALRDARTVAMQRGITMDQVFNG